MMPFIAKWPGVTQPGSRNRNLIQNLDYAETFLEMAGIEIPSDMQGLSLVPFLKARRSGLAHEHLLSLHSIPASIWCLAIMAFGRRYKLMHFYQFGDEWELYDLKNDPDELTNLYGQSKHTRLTKRQQLVALQSITKTTVISLRNQTAGKRRCANNNRFQTQSCFYLALAEEKEWIAGPYEGFNSDSS